MFLLETSVIRILLKATKISNKIKYNSRDRTAWSANPTASKNGRQGALTSACFRVTRVRAPRVRRS